MSKKVSLIFPGQGSQKQGMGLSFYEGSNIAKEMIDNASDKLGFCFKQLLFESNDNLNKTEFSQIEHEYHWYFVLFPQFCTHFFTLERSLSMRFFNENFGIDTNGMTDRSMVDICRFFLFGFGFISTELSSVKSI